MVAQLSDLGASDSLIQREMDGFADFRPEARGLWSGGMESQNIRAGEVNVRSQIASMVVPLCNICLSHTT